MDNLQWLRSPVLSGLCLLLLSCTPEFDSERVVRTRDTLGAEIYKIFCDRVASDELPNDVSGRQTRELCLGTADPSTAPTPRLRAMAEQRDRLVAALDQTLPEPLEDDLDHFMVQLLPFYEPPTELLPTQTRALGELLAKLSADEEGLQALERLSQRVGYRPLRLALGVARPALAYPGIVGFAENALATIDDGGAAGEEWDALLQALALELATAEVDPPSDEIGTLAVTRDLLFTQDNDFAEGTPHYLALRDARGVAMPTQTVPGSVPAPFIDRDNDGQADVDEQGRFVDGRGDVLEVPTPFSTLTETDALRDPIGRALNEDRALLYQYQDVNTTLLAALTREALPWLDPDTSTLLNVAQAAPVMLGPEANRTEEIGGVTYSYRGYDTSASPLLELVHGAATIVDDPETDDLLTLVNILVNDHEEDLAALIDSGLFGDRIADDHPEAVVAADSEVWDDMIQVATWMSQEDNMMEGVIRAFADPRSKRLGSVYAELMRYRDQVDLDPSDMNRPRDDQFWSEPVDRTMGDVGAIGEAGNQSLFQRTLAIIHDLDGVQFCNQDGARLTVSIGSLDVTVPFLSFGECELLQIDNVAEAFALSIIGRFEMDIKSDLLNQLLRIGGLVGLGADELLENQSGITGLTTRPTPQAMARLVFTEWRPFLRNLMSDPVTRDGIPINERHDPVLLAWERSFRFCGDELVTLDAPCSTPETVTFYEAMSPLLEAFDTYDSRTEDRFLFARLITAIHEHWASPDSEFAQEDSRDNPFFVNLDDAKSYEPLLAQLLGDCTWVGEGASRTCDPDEAGQFVQRLHNAAVTLDNIEVRPGVDGITVLARAAETLLDPERNVGLMDREGNERTRTAAGSRSPEQTPLYLLVDALLDVDTAWEGQEARQTRWLAARSTLVDQLLATERRGGEFRLANRRTAAILRIVVPWLQARIAEHREQGDLVRWAANLPNRLETTLGSAVGAAGLHFVDAVDADPVARDEISRIAEYLLDGETNPDTFATTVIATADLLQVLEDERNIVPLLNVLSEGIAPGIRSIALDGSRLTPSDIRLDGSALDESLTLMREVINVDERETLAAVLRNVVSLPESGDAETPLETIIDVIAEVNRVSPGAGGSMDAEDHRRVFEETEAYILGQERGLERLYDVVQSRTISE